MSVHKEHMPSDVELHYKTIHIHKNTDNKDICNTNNKLFMILYNCNFMMYCMRVSYRIFVWGGGALSVLCHTHLIFFENLKLFKKPLTTFKSQNSMKYNIYIITKQLTLSQYSYK